MELCKEDSSIVTGAGSIINVQTFISSGSDNQSFRPTTAKNIVDGGSKMTSHENESTSTIKSSHEPVEISRIKKSDVKVEKCDSKSNSKKNDSNPNEDDSQHSDNGDNDIPGTSRLQTQTTVTDVTPLADGKKCDSLAESPDLHKNATQVANLPEVWSLEGDCGLGTSGLQTKPTEFKPDDLSIINQEASLSEDTSRVPVPVSKASAHSHNLRKRKVKEELSSEKSFQAKKNKKRKIAAPSDASRLEDFQKLAKQGSLKGIKVSPKSLKSHKLVETAKIQGNRGEYKEAKMALEKSFKCLEHQSYPSAKELQVLATECKRKRKHFLTCVLFLLSLRLLAKEPKSCKQIFEKFSAVAKIVEIILKEKKPWPDFSGGAKYLGIAQVISDFMLFVCNRSFGKDVEHDVKLAGHKAHALSWVARVFLKTTLYKKAAKTAIEGKKNLDFAFGKKEEPSENYYLTTVRLFSTHGYAYHKQNIKDQEAQELLKEAVSIEKEAVKRKENQRRTSNTGTQKYPQKVDEKKETQRQTPNTDTQKNPQEVEGGKEDQQQTPDTDAQKRPQVDMKKKKKQRQTETQKRLQEVEEKIRGKERLNKK